MHARPPRVARAGVSYTRRIQPALALSDDNDNDARLSADL